MPVAVEEACRRKYDVPRSAFLSKDVQLPDYPERRYERHLVENGGDPMEVEHFAGRHGCWIIVSPGRC
jgi:hypothetical protein